MAELPRDFPARIRAARAYSGTNRAAFARLLGVGSSTVKNYENGDTRPDERAVAETIKRLAKASGLPEWFFTIGSLHAMRLAAGAGSTDERLAEIERQLAEVVEAVRAEPAALKGRTIEEVVDELRIVGRHAQELINQQGRRIGKRDLQRRSGTGRPDQDREDAA